MEKIKYRKPEVKEVKDEDVSSLDIFLLEA